MKKMIAEREYGNCKEEDLLAEYCRTRDINLRNRLVKRYLYIAEIIAKKFSGKGVEFDDLFQVASLALIKALERYDISKGYKFASFATPTIIGEIKNYFRDRSRIIRLPRKKSELIKEIENARDQLSNQLGRSPNPEEIANYLDMSVEEVLELMESGHMTSIASLDNYVSADEDINLMAFIGEEEKAYRKIENEDFVHRAMATLGEVERKIIYDRFFKRRSQREIAEELGVSQMSISRMEKRILKRLRLYLK